MAADAALQLRHMLEALLAHRRALKASAPDTPIAERIIDASDLARMPVKPPWRWKMEAAATDGVRVSLRASIREEGWRAFAEGGLNAMHALAEAACNDELWNHAIGMLSSCWDGIGTEAGGHWRS